MMDKRITAALAFAIIVQAAGALIWTGRAAQRLEQVERRLVEQSGVAERLARLETEIIDLTRAIERLDRNRGGKGAR